MSVFCRTYLQKLGITALGLCEELLCLHEDLTLAFEEQYEASQDAAVRGAIQIVLPTCVNDGTGNTQKKSWLNMFLTKNNASDHLIDLCEEVLVQKEGITMLGVREALLALHSDLQKEFINHAPFYYHTTNEAENAARAAVKAVVPGYLEHTSKSAAQKQKEQADKNTITDANSDPVYVPMEQD